MIVCSLPLSVFASEIAGLVEEAGMPYVTVSTLYYYDEGTSTDYRALPDMQGYFNLYISLNKAPETDEDIVVYYRTVDESAVAAWGDYESVGTIEEAFVTLNKANSYKAKVTVESKVIDYGFYTNDSSGKRQNDKIVTRRFLFELTRVEGNAELHTPNNGERNQSSLYCYLRANVYNYQNPIAGANTGAWQSNMKDSYWADMQKQFDYYWENDPYFGGEYVVQFWDEVNNIWSKGTANVKYTSLYYSLDEASYLNTPHIKYGGTHSDNINLKFDEDWSNYVVSGLCDLGISINGRLTREKWDSDGDATFNLYYDYQGQKRLALTLYLEGEFDDSQFFGWEP